VERGRNGNMAKHQFTNSPNFGFFKWICFLKKVDFSRIT
jgi:hypothetical protein